jgi:MoxR-like ATPase
MAGRNHVLPDDVKALAIPILAHRISLSGDAFAKGMTERDVLSSILSTVAVPKA